MNEVVRFPEWKALFDSILPLIDGGQTNFDYDELSVLARIDIRSDRGRGQFYKFRRELLQTRQLWMENIPKLGYAIIPAKDQPGAAVKRIRQAKRKANMARAINGMVRFADLTPEQRALQAASAAVLYQVSEALGVASRRINAAGKAVAKGDPIPAFDMQKLLGKASEIQKEALENERTRKEQQQAKTKTKRS